MPGNWTTVMGAVWDGLDSVATTITSSAILMLPVGLAFGFGAVSLAKKLIGIRRR